MLHLQAGIHFHEIKIAAVEQKFDGARPDIPDLACDQDCRRTHAAASVCRNIRRRRFFNQFLVPALDGAIAVAEVNDVAVRIRKDLNFHMTWRCQKPLDQERPVTKGALGQAASASESCADFGFGGDDAHPLPAASCGRLDHQRQLQLARFALQVRQVLICAVISGQYRDTGRAHASFGNTLRAHRGDGRRRRANEHPARIGARRGELRVFREKSVAGMDRTRSSRLRRVQDARDVEITVAGSGIADAYGRVSFAHMAGRRVDL